MNPSVPYPNQAFVTSLPPNPNPSFFFNPNLSYSEPQDLPVKDSSSALSSLKNLIHVANQTIQSLSDLSLIRNSYDDKDSDLIQCPFDRRHRVPPHSLFHHFLLCTSAPQPYIDPINLLHSMFYPKTLESSHKLFNEKRFHQTLPDSDSDLCFSLNDYADSSSNFFYIDCSGAVSLSNQDEMPKVFTLPHILAVECANFVSKDDRQMNSKRTKFQILPSDLWALRGEVEVWNDYPSTYSHIVLCAILGSQMVIDGHLTAWIIANSPRYGVVIDAAMRDHIFLLFRLCFLAFSKEAMGFQNALENGNQVEDGSLMTSRNQSFKCPILIQVLMWLVCQLSMLYGEMNGKFFALDMLRQCILNAASGLLLLPSEQMRTESPTLGKESHNMESSCSDAPNIKLKNSVEKVRNSDNVSGEDTVTSRVIFVSQVAAAVAALHERFLLEEKIKGLRFSHLRTKYQLVSEHNYISQRAYEERKKRCDYRPIIEHDGLPKQQSHNEDTGKNKTREELLAEERDYKRRRMSYRGKKAKRSALQVTRDIIEEYMEEIMKAGGIGCFVKGTEQRGTTSEQQSDHDFTIIADEHIRGSNDSYGVSRHSSSHSKKQSNNNNSKSQKVYYGRNGSPEDEGRGVSKDKYDREHYSRFSDRCSSPSQSHKRKRGPSDQDDEVPTETRRHEIRKLTSRMSHFHDFRSPSSLRSGADSSARKDGHMPRAGDRWKKKSADNHGSELVLNSFSDRYNPSESHDQLEDDYFTGSRYVYPD